MEVSLTPLSFRSPPHTCSYLPEETSSLDYRIAATMDAHQYQQMLEAGWRRHGMYFFRPACPSCTQCRSLRVDVEAFRPSKSQRRAWRKNQHVSVEFGPATVSADHVSLYNRWHADMHHRRGWRNDRTDLQDYADTFLAGAFLFAKEFRYYIDGQLVGVGLVDETPRALSSVYFYYDPSWRPLAPGTYTVLNEIEYARQTGRPWVYLGYWIEACQSMAYKADFKPHQLIDEYIDDQEQPTWR